MDSAKAQRTILESASSRGRFASLLAKGRALRLFRLRTKLILPYVVLTLTLALAGVFVVTRLVVDSAQERFSNSMLDASVVANDGIIRYEKVQLEKLRFLVFAQGMAQALYDRNSEQVQQLMEPVFANAPIDLMAAIDDQGKDVVTYGRDYTTNTYHLQEGVDFSSVSIVQKVLNNEEDPLGDKFVEILKLEQGPILFTSGPVKDAEGHTVGVMMVGTYLDRILNDLKGQALADVILVDRQGNLIATTLSEPEEGYAELLDITKSLQPGQDTSAEKIQLNQRQHEVAFGPLIIRDQQVGWMGVIKNADYLVSETARSRDLLIFLFSIATIAVIVVGFMLAEHIAHPLLELRSMAQAVASGDLNQSIGLQRADEIGDLAESFDTMTDHLRERTEEAARLHAETLQRNRELAEINARLEATQIQLVQSEKLASIGQLTAGIVHDVKNPFAVIMGMAEVLADEESLDEATRHGLKVIRESAVKGNTIVSDLLKFARQSKAEKRELDIIETVKASMRLTAYLTRRYNVTTEFPDTPLLVPYDAQLLEQVLINMIHNAVQAMPNGGALCIGVHQVDDTARIYIQDTGCGIPADSLKRIFDPFFTTKPEGEGTGLGLSVSYGIIANHGGKIDVESEVGKGTRFIIVLPVNQPTLTPGESN
jgi:signal transduction histidine kinase